jgi:hypothetical protein
MEVIKAFLNNTILREFSFRRLDTPQQKGEYGFAKFGSTTES